MQFEGSPEVLPNFWKKKRLMDAGDSAHEAIQPALLVLSGSMRGVYGAAQGLALDEAGLRNVFDWGIGVSAGAPTVGYLIAGQMELGLSIYLEECATPEFISMDAALLRGRPVNLDYISNVFRGSTGKSLDVLAACRSRTAYYITVTHAETGQPVIIDAKRTQPDMVEAIRASIAIPGTSRVVVLDGLPALDGAVAGPLPAQEVAARFRPTDVLILPNRSEGERRGEFLALVQRIMSARLSPAIRNALSCQETVFQSELSWLRGQSDMRYAILWADDGVRALTQERDVLCRVAADAKKHLAGLLVAARH